MLSQEASFEVAESRVPVPGAVVLGELSPATLQRLEKTSAVHLKTPPGPGEARIVEATEPDARSFWRKVSDVVGSEALVVPILADEEGHQLLPTGAIQVRFKSEPSDHTLDVFSARHGLQPGKRNRWSPVQAEFMIRPDDDRYLPDIVDTIAADADIAAVWPDVRGSYKRESA
jgi:hypothetical protein